MIMAGDKETPALLYEKIMRQLSIQPEAKEHLSPYCETRPRKKASHISNRTKSASASRAHLFTPAAIASHSLKSKHAISKRSIGMPSSALKQILSSADCAETEKQNRNEATCADTEAMTGKLKVGTLDLSVYRVPDREQDNKVRLLTNII